MKLRMTDYKPNYDSPFNKGGRNLPVPICMLCFRKTGKHPRMIHLVEGNTKILHPEDTALYTKKNADGGWFEIGSDCAKNLGLEWSVK